MARKKEYLVTGEPKWEPTHPGEILREDVLPALGLSVSEAARQLGITRQTLHKIMAGTMGITPEMAVRIGKFCGNGPNLWLNMQVAYDLWHAKRAMKKEIAKIPTHRSEARA
ncbi:MAG: HigA family addiction module antidote protein [Proteobacteria bacterium]|nr:HigA family addiction module antidote protein [Pseudomonadota bacterium]